MDIDSMSSGLGDPEVYSDFETYSDGQPCLYCRTCGWSIGDTATTLDKVIEAANEHMQDH